MRSSICWRSEGPITGCQKNQKSWLWRHCRRRAIYWLPGSPQTCHAKPKTQINRRRTLPASFLLARMPTASAAWPERLLSEKYGDAVALQIGERGALPKDWSWWYPSSKSTVAAISGASLPGAGYGQFEHGRITHGLQNLKKRAERSERFMRAESSPRLSPLWLSASSARPSWAVNHYRDNAITAPSAKNARELKLANANYWHDAPAWCCCARCKIHEGVSWC